MMKVNNFCISPLFTRNMFHSRLERSLILIITITIDMIILIIVSNFTRTTFLGILEGSSVQ